MKNKIFFNSLLIFLCFSGSLVYFREYISAFLHGFSNFILSCGDFGQYSYENFLFSQTEHIYPFLEPDNEPGLFLVNLIIGKVTNLNITAIFFFTSFLGRLLSLFFISFISKQIFKNRVYSIISVLFSITIFQYSYVYLQLISRQLFSLTFLLGAIYVIFTSRKKISPFLAGLFLAMSFYSHRFGGIIAGISLFIFFLISFPNRKKMVSINIFMQTILFSLPFILFLSKHYYYSLPRFSPDESMFTGNGFNGGFSYLANSGTIFDVPLFHYFLFQGYYCLLIIPHLFLLLKKIAKFNLFYLGVLFSLLLFSLLKLTFSIRSLVSFEAVLLPLFGLTFPFFRNPFPKIILLFCFIILGLTGLNGRLPITFIKVFEKDSSISFLEENFDKSTSIFLTSSRCDADLISQLYFKTGLNSSNNNLSNLVNPNVDILNPASSQVIFEKNFQSLVAGKLGLHAIFQGKTPYLVFGRYADKNELLDLKKHVHPIYTVSFLKLIYENFTSKNIKYIFQVEEKGAPYFSSGYYLRDILRKQK